MATKILFFILAIFVFHAQGLSPVRCPSVMMPQWGMVECKDGVRPGSVCTLSCQEHYDLDGTTDPTIEATCGSDGEWSVSVDFKCTPIRCFPVLQTPMNGDLICSATNLAQSLCVFFCKDHYDMKDVDTDRTSYAVCLDDGNGDEFGEWSQVESGVVFPPSIPPVCEPVRCPYPMVAPENGQVICSATDYSGSTCVFYCEEGYKFAGKDTPVEFSNCKDDVNYDSVGYWTMPEVPTCEKIADGPGCGAPPSAEGIEFTCDSMDYPVGGTCEAKCTSYDQKIDGDSTITCSADMRWDFKKMPRCVQCKRVKSLEIMALIHESENNDEQYDVAVRMVSKVVTILKRKFRFRPMTVKVNRYATTVDASTQVVTTNYDSKVDKPKIEAIPFPGNFESAINAITYADSGLTESDRLQVVVILTNRFLTYDEAAAMAADNVKAKGVKFIAIQIPQRNRMLTVRKEHLVSFTGDENSVFFVGNQKDVEKYKAGVAQVIYNASMKKGCMM